MNAQTLKTLSTVPPPKRKFYSAKEAHQEINRLEALLEVQPSRFTANIREAGDKIDQLAKLLAAKAPPAPTPVAADRAPTAAMELQRMTALSNLIQGPVLTKSILENWKDSSHGAERHAASTKRCEEARKQFGASSPAANAEEIKRAELWVKLESERAGTDADKLRRLTQSFLDAGITHPALNFKGCRVSVAGNHVAKMDACDLPVAQKMISEFLAATGSEPDLALLTAHTPAGHAARQFLTATGRINDFGKLTL